MSFHPTKSDLFLLYEVVGDGGITTWEGDSPARAVEAFKDGQQGCRLLVSGWLVEGEDGDAHLVGQPLDVTALVGAVRGGWVW